jgi:hypothetical protein
MFENLGSTGYGHGGFEGDKHCLGNRLLGPMSEELKIKERYDRDIECSNMRQLLAKSATYTQHNLKSLH